MECKFEIHPGLFNFFISFRLTIWNVNIELYDEIKDEVPVLD